MNVLLLKIESAPFLIVSGSLECHKLDIKEYNTPAYFEIL